ncbi:DUF4097 family beta strand repeat-containing protein [Nocardia sp. CDC160]|uniref:DUF4097 family beta strand repeat-containing protein n=1 Tax=Nocardia sp. CDC160 TaxID=3112166 RepID=UPI002DB5727E|nr:DUF4097 family beta strand repeat-containing protein [Nocardia sp. CDC160]MEC3915761.1 DUF4097 family beta strand repeat-containing protein [Nocardia sp. CDC160]
MTVFQTPAPIAADIEVALGTVTVIASDRTDTVVDVRPTDTAKKADVKAAEQLKVDFAGGTLSVALPKGPRVFGPGSGKGSVQVTVQVPSGSGLKGSLAVGEFRTAGAFGPIEVEVATGDIVIGQAFAAVTAKAAKGDIAVEDAVRGVLRLDTSVGDLRIGIHPGSASRVETNSPNGGVSNQLGAVDPAQENVVEVYAHTATGNVTVGNATV